MLTSIIAAATIANVVIFYCESESSAKQTTRVITEAGGIANSTENSVRQNQAAIDKAAEANQKAIEASNAQNRKLVDASIAQGKTALKASIDSSTNDQRAWIGMSEATPPVIKEGSKVTFTIILLNSGKSPALEVVQLGAWKLSPSAERLDYRARTLYALAA